MQLTEYRKFKDAKAATMTVFAFVGMPVIALTLTSPAFWNWVAHG